SAGKSFARCKRHNRTHTRLRLQTVNGILTKSAQSSGGSLRAYFCSDHWTRRISFDSLCMIREGGGSQCIPHRFLVGAVGDKERGSLSYGEGGRVGNAHGRPMAALALGPARKSGRQCQDSCRPRL